MKRKIIAILLVLTMAVCAFPMSAFAADNDESAAPRYIASSNDYCIYIALEPYTVPYGTVLSYGSKGGHVYTAQMKLNEVSMKEKNASISVGTVDGDFGNNTRNGTYAFQRWFNTVNSVYGMSEIGVDGVIGNQTWTAFSKLMYLF